jgi:hypothetical protein
MVEMRLLCFTEKDEIVAKAEGLDDRYREVKLATGYRAPEVALPERGVLRWSSMRVYLL